MSSCTRCTFSHTWYNGEDTESQTRINERKKKQTKIDFPESSSKNKQWKQPKSNQDSIYNLDEITIENYKLGIETLKLERNQIKIQFAILMNSLQIGNWNPKIGKKTYSNYEEENLDFNVPKKSRWWT